MKAWKVSNGSEWIEFVHSLTEGKAKSLVFQEFGDGDFVDYRANRYPELDGKPITFETIAATGFHYIDIFKGGFLKPDEFFPICCCKICKLEKDHG